ncbi:hypothetical protein O9993_05505 [Vibrio lentus]|nr:hypothetical protein [Vibrio lentus]
MKQHGVDWRKLTRTIINVNGIKVERSQQSPSLTDAADLIVTGGDNDHVEGGDFDDIIHLGDSGSNCGIMIWMLQVGPRAGCGRYFQRILGRCSWISMRSAWLDCSRRIKLGLDDDVILGGSGIDLISGGSGNDYLDGGSEK